MGLRVLSQNSEVFGMVEFCEILSSHVLEGFDPCSS